MKLKDRVVLVTGSSAGIGKETAMQFAQKGCKVIVTYNKGKEGGKKVLKECKKYGDTVLLHLDVRDDRSIDRVVKAVLKKFGRVDILVNNAGVVSWGDLIKQSRADIEEQIRVNLTGLIKVTRAFLPRFYEQREGLIINIGSGAAKEGFAGLAVYCASKFGVRGFTRALAQELPKGVRIYCVNPGQTATRMTGFKGVHPSKVAEIIVRTAEEKLGKRSGDDIDVWEYL